jgi:hypothetical protein
MWPKRTVAAIESIIVIEWQRSGTIAEWKYGTVCATTMIISSITDGGELAGGGQGVLPGPYIGGFWNPLEIILIR